MVALPCFNPDGTPTQEALRKFENNVLGGKIKDIDNDSINDLAIAGKRTAKFFEKLSNTAGVNRLFLSPTINLASSPFVASRKVGSLIGHLGLIRNGDATDAVGRISVESRIKTFDKHTANIRQALDKISRKNSTLKNVGDLYNISQEAQDQFAILKTKLDEIVKPRKPMNDQEAVHRLLGAAITGMHRQGEGVVAFTSTFVDIPPEDALRNAIRTLLNDDSNPSQELIDVLFDAAKQTDELLRDIIARGDFSGDEATSFVTNVHGDLKSSFDSQSIRQNKQEFIDVVFENLKKYKDNIAELKEVLPFKTIDDQGYIGVDSNSDLILSMSDDNLKDLAIRISVDIINRDRTMPLSKVNTIGMTIGNIEPNNINLSANMKSSIFDGLGKYRISSLNDVMEGLTRKTGVDAELVSTFGTTNIDDITKYLKAINEKEINTQYAGDANLIKKMTQRSDDDIKNITEMVAYLRGELQRPENYDSPLWKAERAALTWNNVRLLGAAGIGSVPEMGKIAMIFGFRNTVGQALNSFGRGLKLVRHDIAADDLRAASIGLDTILSTTGKARNSMDEFAPTVSNFDNKLNWINEKFFMANMLNQVTSTTKRVAGRMALNRMLHSIFDIADGKTINKAERNFLSKYGISTKEAKIIAKQVKGTKEKGFEYDIKGTFVANMDYWDTSDLSIIDIRNNFQAALRQVTDDVIVSPGLDRPLFFTRPGVRLITQFKAFNMSSLQKTSIATFQQFAQGDQRAQLAIGASSMIALGTSYVMFREMMKGNDPSKDLAMNMYNGFDRSGLFGTAGDITTILGNFTGGYGNPSYYFGDEYAGQNANTGSRAKAIGGVSVGLIDDVAGTVSNAVQGITGADNWTDADNRRLYRLAPMQNYMMWRNITDRLTGSNLSLRN